jgi:hypothetical protein
MAWQLLFTKGPIPKVFERQSQSEYVESSGLRALEIVDDFLIRFVARLATDLTPLLDVD